MTLHTFPKSADVDLDGLCNRALNLARAAAQLAEGALSFREPTEVPAEQANTLAFMVYETEAAIEALRRGFDAHADDQRAARAA